jgi:flagellar basal body-associated protein FliL
MEKISRFNPGLILITLLVVGGFFTYFFMGKAEIVQKQEKNSAQVLDLEDKSGKIRTFMPPTGTRWVYEGKRTFYDIESQSVKEAIAQKVVEVTGIMEGTPKLRHLF